MQDKNRSLAALMARYSILGVGALAAFSMPAQAMDLGEVVLATGYRQDSSSFAICSGLASPDFYGFGKLRSRDVHVWEIGIGASLGLTDNVYLRSAVSYGTILGGDVDDSGVADINSDPLNSILGHYYTGCCGPCDCETPCGCDCGDRILRETVQATADLRGNVVDFNIAIGYAFRPMDDFMLAPVVGWTYNSQRQRWKHASFGPFNTFGELLPCDDSSIILQGLPDFNYWSITNPDTEVVEDVLLSGFEGCISFGNCFDGTTYRARWNGPFIGIDFGWDFSDQANIVIGYALSYNNFNGKFETFGSEECDCDQCPALGHQTTDEGCVRFQEDTLYAFVPSEMSFSSWGLGQEVMVGANFQCDRWTGGIALSYTYKNATHCADSDPCESCNTVVNPLQELDPGRTAYPVWSNAQLTKARWGSFSALLTLGYDF